MLSLRCRINANVAELLVIIGYSELGPTLGARPFALRRSLGRLPARLPLFPLIPRLFTLGSLARLSGLSPGCLVAVTLALARFSVDRSDSLSAIHATNHSRRTFDSHDPNHD